ncbi:neuronal acetylcholine receptor subunit non-alpha-3-like [Pecten maximus]|uniref:neuronal acetylcholine receptor subunit non-alpha-3-like n=1 Tax=Pecten maximus TaxID=6579 RepID=UPI00145884F6|nr:neuronal acetylcholine receptor subunit non-alpha-3-like [Pecten maximus]
MKLHGTVVLLGIFCCVHYGIATSGTIEDMENLIDKIFTNYRREIRPARNLNETVQVNISFFLISIADLDEVSGAITINGGISMHWRDFRLSWKPSDHAGIRHLMLNSSMIWKPKIFILSSASDIERFESDEFDAEIRRNGLVLMTPGKRFAANCEIDMTNFPTDRQKCSMTFIAWGYPSTEIYLTSMLSHFLMDFFSPHGEWDVEETSAEAYSQPDVGSSKLVYYFILKRKSPYFFLTMIVPVYILCFLNPFVFLLPAASGERISYTITIFLSLAVYMTLVDDNMPKVSEPMAGISYFLLIAMIYSCVLIILTIFTLRCEALTDVSIFPKCLRRIVFKKNRQNSRKMNYSTNSDSDVVKSESYDVNVVGNTTEHGKKEENFPEPDKSDIMKCIDISLFVLSEAIVFGLILGFAMVYYK